MSNRKVEALEWFMANEQRISRAIMDNLIDVVAESDVTPFVALPIALTRVANACEAVAREKVQAKTQGVKS
jgi:hypothetical protein